MSREDPDTTAPERQILQDLLDDNRAEVLALLDGLTEEQARRSLVPSLTTPLGLVKHAAFAEKVWFHVTLTGRTRAEVGIPEDIDESFELVDEDTVESVRAAFRATCAESDRIAAPHSLDDIGMHSRRGAVSVRWMYVHMIEELARHAGHGDILREQILATDTQVTVRVTSQVLDSAHVKAASRGEVVEEWLAKKLQQYGEFANNVPREQRHRR